MDYVHFRGNRISNPDSIEKILLADRVDAPSSWSSYVSLASRFGLSVVAVRWVHSTIWFLDLGMSPGTAWAYRGSVYVASDAHPQDVLHEICHWLVASSEHRVKVNFGDNAVNEESDTCDLQVCYVLCTEGASAARDLAENLNFVESDLAIRVSMTDACARWASLGVHLELTEALMAELASRWIPHGHPDLMWSCSEAPMGDDPDVQKVLSFARQIGVQVTFAPVSDLSVVSRAPRDSDSGSMGGHVWWWPSVDQEVPPFMRLLHEVAHAATGQDGRPVGSEPAANAFELAACIFLWGVQSPQVRACIRWGKQGSWSLDECRWTWKWWMAHIETGPVLRPSVSTGALS